MKDMHVHVYVPLHTCDIYTYMHVHVPLALYSHSPSAFEAVKHLGILQLPSTASLQAFMSLHQRSLGANEQQMALQHKLCSQHVEKNRCRGKIITKTRGYLYLMRSKFRERSYGIPKITRFLD